MDSFEDYLISVDQTAAYQDSARSNITGKKLQAEKNKIRRQQALLKEEEKTLYKKTRKNLVPKATMCHIDSRYRIVKEDPDANNFRAYLGRSFTNVVEVSLKSTEFPNSDAVIKSTSNAIYWINQEDRAYNYLPYSVILKTGYYTSSQLATELEDKLRTIKRSDGSYHYFLVSIDTNSDLVTFVSLRLTALANAPISTIRGTNQITVSHANHGYQTGDSIYVIGASSISGIQSTIINNSKFSITVLDASSYTIEVNVIASDTLTGGGNSVKIGVESPFQFLFGEYTDNPSSKLGFQLENSSEKVNMVDDSPLHSKVLTLDNIVIVSPDTILVQSMNHGLQIDDQLILSKLVTVPNISAKVLKVLSVIDSNSFMVQVSIDSFVVASLVEARIRTNIFTLDFSSPHGFNRIIEISNYDATRLIVYTLYDHNLSQGQTVTLYPRQGYDLVIGYMPYTVDVLSPDSFLIDETMVLLEPVTHAYIDVVDSFYIYHVDNFDEYMNLEVSKKKLFIREIESPTAISFAVDNVFMNQDGEFGGSSIRISSSNHGFRGKQTNRDSDQYQSIDLSGENYVYLISERLGGTATTNYSGVENIFAKIKLSASPGAIIFDSYIATPKTFSPPLPELTYFDLKVMTVDKSLYDFNKLDFSFSLQVTELIEPLDDNV